MADVQILPPGPSPEFLRRQAMYAPSGPDTATVGSFDPATGVRESQTFNTQVTPPATSEMQMLESIRQQVNAMHFKNAQDAMNAAVQFQHMREAQRMREAGANEQQIWATLGRGMVWSNPNTLVGMTRALEPTPEPQLTNFGGANAVVHGKNKAVSFVPRAAVPAQPLPASVREIPIEKEDGTISEDEYAVPSANGKGFVVRRRAQKKESITPSARLSALKDQIEEDQKELGAYIIKTKKELESPQVQQRKRELEQRIRESQAERSAMTQGAAATASSTQTGGGYVIGKTYKGGLKYLGGDPSDEASWEKVK